jgi:hypothetical protein
MNIVTGNLNITVQLNRTRTAEKLLDILPVISNVSRWGDEIYFSIPLRADIEDGVEEVEIGTVAFWPPGSALCIFFGPTPASHSDKPRAASPVTVIGRIVEIDADLIKRLKEVKNGEEVAVNFET